MFSVENKRKKKALVLNQLTFIPHKIEREFYYRNFQSGFFRLNVELNTKTKKNDEIELFYYFLVCGAVYIYTEKLHGVPLTKDPDVDKYWTQSC